MTDLPDGAGPTQEDYSFSIDYDALKERLREAMRGAIQDRANELGLSYEAYVERHLEKQPPSG
jgi:hypothetical protein